MSYERAYNLVSGLIRFSPHGITFIIQTNDSSIFTLSSHNIEFKVHTSEHVLIKINSGFIVYLGQDTESYPVSNRGQIFFIGSSYSVNAVYINFLTSTIVLRSFDYTTSKDTAVAKCTLTLINSNEWQFSGVSIPIDFMM